MNVVSDANSVHIGALWGEVKVHIWEPDSFTSAGQEMLTSQVRNTYAHSLRKKISS